MATPSQIAANQANAKKSSGPKTPEGRAASSRNRLSHGFLSNTYLLPDENIEDFQALILSLIDQHEPVNPTEQILVEKMAVNQWLSLRAFRLQTDAFTDQINRDEGKFGIPKELGLLIRYKTTAENAFHRAHNELVKAQKERRKSEIGFESQEAVASPETEPKKAPSPPAATDFPAESAATGAHEAPQVAPNTPGDLKNAA